MELIRISNFSINYNGAGLFNIPDLKIISGKKIGLIGNNGSGKTSLLKAINGEISSFTGSVIKSVPTILVSQLLSYEDASGGEIEKNMIKKAIHNLKQDPQALLLDEPTSNLDIEQQTWLVNLLKSLPNAMLVISHDRNFLNKIVNVIWNLQDKEIFEFKGSYHEFENFESTKNEKELTNFKYRQNKIKNLKKIQEKKLAKGKSVKRKKKNISWSDWKTKNSERSEKGLLKISKNLTNKINSEKTNLIKPKTRKSISPKNAIKTLENDKKVSKLNLIKIEPQELELKTKKLFSIKNSLIIKYTDKIILTGKNGVGKSAFLKQLYEGNLKRKNSDQLKIGYFNQNIKITVSNKSVISVIMKETIFDKSSTLQILGDLNLKHHLNNKLNQLSGGQLVSFNLAKILVGNYNLLLLDEPNNFLDINSISALEEFIKDYPFALIVVSHDQEFLKKLELKKWKIKDKKLIPARIISLRENENELELLKFKRDRMLSDINIPMDEVKKVNNKIKEIEDK